MMGNGSRQSGTKDKGDVMATVNLDQELTDEQFRLIGVELRVGDNYGVQQELAVFGTSIVLPRKRSLMTGSRYPEGYLPNVTIHTTLGDYTFAGYDYANW